MTSFRVAGKTMNPITPIKSKTTIMTTKKTKPKPKTKPREKKVTVSASKLDALIDAAIQRNIRLSTELMEARDSLVACKADNDEQHEEIQELRKSIQEHVDNEDDAKANLGDAEQARAERAELWSILTHVMVILYGDSHQGHIDDMSMKDFKQAPEILKSRLSQMEWDDTDETPIEAVKRLNDEVIKLAARICVAESDNLEKDQRIKELVAECDKMTEQNKMLREQKERADNNQIDPRDPKDVAMTISRFVNSTGMEEMKELAQLMVNDHRTLVQTKMRLFVAFCELLKHQYDDQMFDIRNEASCKLANAIMNIQPPHLLLLPYA